MLCAGFPLWWLLLLWSVGSRCARFSSCSTRAQQLLCTGLVAPWHVGSSRTRDRTPVPFIGRQILNHCATREDPGVILDTSLPLLSSSTANQSRLILCCKSLSNSRTSLPVHYQYPSSRHHSLGYCNDLLLSLQFFSCPPPNHSLHGQNLNIACPRP